MTKSWNRTNKSDRRKPRIEKESILIVCEGEKTEPIYFSSFRISSVKFDIEGAGKNTLSLVNKAIYLGEQAKADNEEYDQIWCVFDRDSFPLQNFNNAISKAKSNDIKVAYSNESFELWYILHFEYLQSQIPRSDYIIKLNEHLGREYSKNDKLMYNELLGKQRTAIRNAKKLLAFHSSKKPADSNPSTTVFILVEELNKYL